MKPWKHTLWVVLAVLVILSLLLSACVTITLGDSDGNSNHGKDKEKNKDNGNGNNKEKEASSDKITICHKTGSAKHPYLEINVSKSAAQNGHVKHTGDIIPAPKKGCPAQ